MVIGGDERWDRRIQNAPTNPNTNRQFGLGQIAIGNNVNVSMNSAAKQNTGGGNSGISGQTTGFDLGRGSNPDDFSIGNNSNVNISMSPGHYAIVSYNRATSSASSGISIGSSKLTVNTVNNGYGSPSSGTPSIWANSDITVKPNTNESTNSPDDSPNISMYKNVQSDSPTMMQSRRGNIDLSGMGHGDFRLQNYGQYKNDSLDDPLLQVRNSGSGSQQSSGPQIMFPGAEPLNAWDLNGSNNDGPSQFQWQTPSNGFSYPKQTAINGSNFNIYQYSRLKVGTSTTQGNIEFTHPLNDAHDSKYSRTISGRVTDNNGKGMGGTFVSLTGDPNISPDDAVDSINDGYVYGYPYFTPKAPDNIGSRQYTTYTNSDGTFEYTLPKGKYLSADETINGFAAYYDRSNSDSWFQTNEAQESVDGVSEPGVINPYEPQTPGTPDPDHPDQTYPSNVDAGDQVSGKNNPANNNPPAMLRLDAVPQSMQFNMEGKNSTPSNGRVAVPISQDGTSLAYNPNSSDPGIFTQFTNSAGSEMNDVGWGLTVTAQSGSAQNNLLNNASLDLGGSSLGDGFLQELSLNQDKSMLTWNKTGNNLENTINFDGQATPIVSSSNVDLDNSTYQAFWNLANVKLNLDENVLKNNNAGLGGNSQNASGTLTWNLSHGPSEGN
ncbi:hypothetical protein [Fructilactobacillus fructivorans]|uniref:hypothetical protein n=1 Tax=Fructilactobacillus fructivorans TaxID=1614 RepID=UPI0012E8F77F|nr:hypothetical protein [Fructilactobacillus fructivorans]